MQRALVMAFDQAFAVGAETALRSVLRFNPWFDGTVIVFSSDLDARARARFNALYPVEFRDDDPALGAITEQLGRSRRASAGFGSRFSSLQLFSVVDVDRAVFIDADTICLGDLRPLFASNADFTAAPDTVELRRALTRASSGARSPNPPTTYEPYGRTLSYSFNSGILSVSRRWLGPSTYRDLLDLPGFRCFLGGARELADQYVLNHYFDGKTSPLDPRYNFVVRDEALARKLFDLELEDICILHFAGSVKPWELSWSEARRTIAARLLPYYERWHDLRRSLEPRTG